MEQTLLIRWVSIALALMVSAIVVVSTVTIQSAQAEECSKCVFTEDEVEPVN